MELQIAILSFQVEKDQNTAIIFDNFGLSKERHKNLFRYIAYTDANEDGLYASAKKHFKINELPTVVFAQVIQQEPLILKEIIRHEGDYTTEILEIMFKNIVDGKTPIPLTGNNGKIISIQADPSKSIDGESGGGFGVVTTGFQFPKWGYGLLAGLGTYKALGAKSKLGQVGYTGVSAFLWGKTFSK
ncbi:MAG: hypothetical protein AAGJ18_21070 [Bacteroidota bacterium]